MGTTLLRLREGAQTHPLAQSGPTGLPFPSLEPPCKTVTIRPVCAASSAGAALSPAEACQRCPTSRLRLPTANTITLATMRAFSFGKAVAAWTRPQLRSLLHARAAPD